MLPEIAITGLLEGSVNELGFLVHSHPTLSEAVKEAALAANGRGHSHLRTRQLSIGVIAG